MYFKTEKISKRQFIPPIVFTKLAIQNNAVNARIKDNSINLASDERDIAISFTALDYNQGKNIRYAFKLNGIDKNWTVNTGNTVYYMNLPPGKHLFEILSTNADGQWVNNIESLAITVNPSFKETIWFWLTLLLGFSLFLLVILLIARKIYHLNSSFQLEKKITEMRLHFFTETSH